jgi:hypothetical protein
MTQAKTLDGRFQGAAAIAVHSGASKDFRIARHAVQSDQSGKTRSDFIACCFPHSTPQVRYGVRRVCR